METQTKETQRADIETETSTLSAISAGADAIFDSPSQTQMGLEQRLERRKQLLKICFEITSPTQWVIFQSEKDGKSTATAYPQGGAADAIIRHILACTWQEKHYELTNDANGEPLSCEYSATLYSRDGRPIERFTGFREIGGYVKNKADLISGAQENCKSKCVRDLLGLRGRSLEELAALGLDLGRVGTAEFKNNKSGNAATLPGFGRDKGKAMDDPTVTLASLQWYLGKSNESLADPDKAKYRKSEQKNSTAIKAEIARREKAAATPTAPMAPPLSAAEAETIEQFSIRVKEEAQTEATLAKIGAEIAKAPEAVRVALQPVYAKRLAELRKAAPAEPGSAG